MNSALRKVFLVDVHLRLLLEDKIILDVGGVYVGLVALSLNSGETLWKSKPYGNDYASVVPLKTSLREMIVAFMRQGLVVVDAKNGDEVYFDKFQSPINASVNAASPLITKKGSFSLPVTKSGQVIGNFQKKRGEQSLLASGKNMESLTVIIQLLLNMKIIYMGFMDDRKEGHYFAV